jgi:D-glycero-alpha-D-manno-heptose-7-phosphate kinase
MWKTTIRSRAPLRLGLAGGGTDLSPFCDEYNGAVLNCTIDRYAYAFIDRRADNQIVFRARDLGLEERHEPGALLDASEGLQLHRGAYNFFFGQGTLRDNIGGMTLTTTVDAPPGSGLGSSSSLVVAICEAFTAAFEIPLGRYDLAHLAFKVERVDLGLAGGKQDQYAAAFGGINFIEFLPEDRVIVNPLRVERAILNEIEASLVVCFTGISRTSDSIIREQTTGMTDPDSAALSGLFDLKRAAVEMKQAVLTGDIMGIADLLNWSWMAKKKTSASVSNEFIETLVEVGRRAGASAAKVSGAGGGGFIMFLVRPEDRISVVDSLNRAGGRAGPVHLTTRGVESWREPVIKRPSLIGRRELSGGGTPFVVAEG